jgi:hypothetical protein
MHALTNCLVKHSLGLLTITGWAHGARLKSVDARNLLKPVKVAPRTKDKVAKSPDELLKWIKDLHPRFHTELRRVPKRLPGQRTKLPTVILRC